MNNDGIKNKIISLVKRLAVNFNLYIAHALGKECDGRNG